MCKITMVICFVVLKSFGQNKYQQDFLFYWETLDTYFAYLDQKETDLKALKDKYYKQFESVTNHSDFIKKMETVNRELYCNHCNLNVNLSSSFRMIPSSSELYVSYQKGCLLIESVKYNSKAYLSGLRKGMKIIKVNHQNVNTLIQLNMVKRLYIKRRS